LKLKAKITELKKKLATAKNPERKKALQAALKVAKKIAALK